MENQDFELKNLYDIRDFTREVDTDIRDAELLLLADYPDSCCEYTGKSIKDAIIENKSLNGYVIRDKETKIKYKVQLSEVSKTLDYRVYKLVKQED